MYVVDVRDGIDDMTQPVRRSKIVDKGEWQHASDHIGDVT
jgi:hypothetical protein